MTPFSILWVYKEAFLSGFGVSAELVLFAAAIGTALGTLLEFLANRSSFLIRRILDGGAFCVAAIPALVVLFWLYYPGQEILGINTSPFTTAITALSLINTFAVYRIASDAVRDMPKQFVATGLVCGLTERQIFWHIDLPLLLRVALPRWIDQQVIILQTSLFASLISVDETFRVAQRVNSIAYAPVIIYTSMAILFLGTAGTAMYLANYLRQKFYRDLSER